MFFEKKKKGAGAYTVRVIKDKHLLSIRKKIYILHTKYFVYQL